MSTEYTGRRVTELACQAARVRSWSRSLQSDAIHLARQVADTEQAVAKTLAVLTSQHLAHANRLRRQARGRRG